MMISNGATVRPRPSRLCSDPVTQISRTFIRISQRCDAVRHARLS